MTGTAIAVVAEVRKKIIKSKSLLLKLEKEYIYKQNYAALPGDSPYLRIIASVNDYVLRRR
jgi:hypothetical protein